MPVWKVSCPSCGANIEIPPSLTRAHCVYCGSEILIAPEAESQRAARQAGLKVSLGLLKIAMEAWNLSDIIRYADSVLELDPNSSYAWYCKGVATCELPTWIEDRWEEARTYLDKAIEIDPDNQDARAARDTWPYHYSEYLYELSQQQWETAEQIWRAECIRSFGFIADRKAAPYFAAALATLDNALSVLADMPVCLERDQYEYAITRRMVRFLIQHAVPQFGDTEPLSQRLEELKAKVEIQQDMENLPLLHQKLKETAAKIARIEAQGGFLARLGLGRLREERDKYLQRIKRAVEFQKTESR